MLTKEDILRGLHKIDNIAKSKCKIIDIAIFGGAALSIVYDLRQSTKDVDVVILQDSEFLRWASDVIADEEGWTSDWLNDGVKGFVSEKGRLEVLEIFQPDENGGLRIYIPTPEYLFAMKCMAMRPEGVDGSKDISDIEFLVGKLEITSTEAAIEIVELFYPKNRISPKVYFGIEEIVERMMEQSNSEFNPNF